MHSRSLVCQISSPINKWPRSVNWSPLSLHLRGQTDFALSLELDCHLLYWGVWAVRYRTPCVTETVKLDVILQILLQLTGVDFSKSALASIFQVSKFHNNPSSYPVWTIASFSNDFSSPPGNAAEPWHFTKWSIFYFCHWNYLEGIISQLKFYIRWACFYLWCHTEASLKSVFKCDIKACRHLSVFIWL